MKDHINDEYSISPWIKDERKVQYVSAAAVIFIDFLNDIFNGFLFAQIWPSQTFWYQLGCKYVQKYPGEVIEVRKLDRKEGSNFDFEEVSPASLFDFCGQEEIVFFAIEIISEIET